MSKLAAYLKKQPKTVEFVKKLGDLEVFVWRINVQHADRYFEATRVEANENDPDRHAKALAFMICDKDGNQIFSQDEADIAELRQVDFYDFVEIKTAFFKLNGLGDSEKK